MIALGRTGMSKSHWLQLAGVCWLVVSVWPVKNYYFPARPIDLPNLPLNPSQPILSYKDNLVTSRTIDHFASYHKSTQCTVSSLDLHQPSYPLCPEQDTASLLRAIGGGGRIGTDAPYQPRGCDMRWFSTEEICDILSRFSRVSVMGDSLMRDIAIAFHVFLRKDLVHGAQQQWVPGPEGIDCSCEAPWNVKACNWYITINSQQVYAEHAELMACPKQTTAYIKYHALTSYPLPDDQITGYKESAFLTKPPKPHAIIMGAGLWDDLEHAKTKAWVDQVVNATAQVSPWAVEPGQMQPMLFVTPNAAHAAKNPKHAVKQGNIPLSVFEQVLGAYVKDVHGIDHLGTFNMSVQASSFDGTHGGMRVNLLKVMAIFNWLNSLDVLKW